MKISRRDFVKSLGRAAFLGLIAGSASLLFFKRRFSMDHAHTCINQGICRGCREFDDCILPQALSVKNGDVSRRVPGD